MRSMMLVQVVGFSSMFMSTGQVPLHFMEGWLRVVAGFNPMTDVLQFARQGFLGPLSWSTTWPGASALLLLVLATGLAARRSLGKMAS
jgi:ABC-type polysaccharide/polyol phosphate export permease